jgi:hypothetical protein
MANNFNTNTKNNDEWLTPPSIVKSLGDFDLDPCSPVNPPWLLTPNQYTVYDNGLLQKWDGRVWLNPPYGRETFKWLFKLALHRWGVALIFARTETKGFHATVWNMAHSVFFFEGRLSFYYVDGTQGNAANAPSCLVSYSQTDTHSIEKSGLKGKLVYLKNYPLTVSEK